MIRDSCCLILKNFGSMTVMFIDNDNMKVDKIFWQQTDNFLHTKKNLFNWYTKKKQPLLTSTVDDTHLLLLLFLTLY